MKGHHFSGDGARDSAANCWAPWNHHKWPISFTAKVQDTLNQVRRLGTTLVRGHSVGTSARPLVIERAANAERWSDGREHREGGNKVAWEGGSPQFQRQTPANAQTHFSKLTKMRNEKCLVKKSFKV